MGRRREKRRGKKEKSRKEGKDKWREEEKGRDGVDGERRGEVEKRNIRLWCEGDRLPRQEMHTLKTTDRTEGAPLYFGSTSKGAVTHPGVGYPQMG